MRVFLIAVNFVALGFAAVVTRNAWDDTNSVGMIFGALILGYTALNLTYAYATDTPRKGRLFRFFKSVPKTWKESA